MLLLSLDLSTTATGWALWEIKNKSLNQYGVIKPKVPKVSKLPYPKRQLAIMKNMANQIVELVLTQKNITRIVIEEVNLGKNRHSQKTLDGFHYILVDRLGTKIDLVFYKDSDGPNGWRTNLNFKLSENDKRLNKLRRKNNKKRPKGSKKARIINKKDLACRFVNLTYGLKLSMENKATDGDIADAIGLGHAVLHFHLT